MKGFTVDDGQFVLIITKHELEAIHRGLNCWATKLTNDGAEPLEQGSVTSRLLGQIAPLLSRALRTKTS